MSLIKKFCIGFAEGLREVRWERLLAGFLVGVVIYGIEELSRTAKAQVRRKAKRFNLDDFGISLN